VTSFRKKVSAEGGVRASFFPISSYHVLKHVPNRVLAEGGVVGRERVTSLVRPDHVLNHVLEEGVASLEEEVFGGGGRSPLFTSYLVLSRPESRPESRPT